MSKKHMGRPRVRDGREVQVTVEFPVRDYATLCGWIERRKQIARAEGTLVSEASKRTLLTLLWRQFWAELPQRERTAVLRGDRYKEELKRRS